MSLRFGSASTLSQTDEDGDPAPIPAGRVPLSWLSNRRIAHARLKGRFADVGDPDTLRWLAQRLPEVLVR